MVHTPAPSSRHEDASRVDWTTPYLVGARRARVRSVFAVSLAVGAWSLFASTRTGAESQVATVDASSAPTPSTVSSPSATNSTVSAPADAPAVAAPAPATTNQPAVAPVAPSAPLLATPQTAPAATTPQNAPTASAPQVVTPQSTLPQGVAPQAAPTKVLPPVRTMRFAVKADGRIHVFTVSASEPLSLEAALRRAKFSLGPQDRLVPARSTPLRDRLHARVTRVKTVTRTRYEPIRFETRFKPTNAIRRGTQQTLQVGREGATQFVERVWFKDGQVSGVELLSKRVSRRAQHTIIALGAKRSYLPNNVRPHRRYARAIELARENSRAFRGGSPLDVGRGGAPFGGTLAPANPGTFRAVKMLHMEATGYAAGPAGGSLGNITATGMPCGYGAVAVDPRVIPLGSKLFIEGYGYGFACDTGGAIKGHKIDLAFDSVRAAFANGRRRVRVWILQ